jgi:hypothetical protein
MMCIQEITMDQTNPPAPQDTSGPLAEQQALLQALDGVLLPLAQLCVAKGIPVPALEERVRQAFVSAARDRCDGANPQRLNSRISTLTGLTRREVTRIQSQLSPARPANRSAVSEIFTHWLTLPTYQGEDGPRSLARVGPAPSFDTLAQSVTRDVHPRSLLEALCRLGLAEHETETDTVRLLTDAFVPRDQWAQMVGFLGDNVGDHLRAAVTNVLGQGHEHFEQALFADELSAESLQEARQLITRQWRRLMTDMAPRLAALMQADALAGRAQDQSLRLGLYSWTQAMENDATQPTPEIPKEE